MTGQQRRAQLLDVARSRFASKGFDATSIEEIAQTAGVSKPVVYEHFGGKEGMYAVIVDREVQHLLGRITEALDGTTPRELLEQAALAFLTYIEEEPDGFTILVRDSPLPSSTGTLASVIGDIASQVEYVLVNEFKRRGFDVKLAPLYSRALVGMVGLVGQWWLDTAKPRRDVVAAHLVNLAWNGLKGLEQKPRLVATPGAGGRRTPRPDDLVGES
ncbi:MAG: TetR/AcrR family transcriptional regulator [Actinomycetota bacterium]|nr:TetR/AcrR family transcriptional regulator [Actinomycetota bacterium]